MIKLTDTHIHTFARGTLTALSLFSLMIAGVYFEKQERANASSLTASVNLSKRHVSPGALKARAAILYDAKTGEVLYGKDIDTEYPLASLTKLMSASTVLSLKSSDELVTISLEDLASEGDSGFMVGDVWSLRNLLTIGLVESSNDAMAAAAASACTSSIVNRMNESAAAIGLKNMRFNNVTGLDIDEATAGAYGSAREMAIIAAEFLKNHPDLFGVTISQRTRLESKNSAIDADPTASPLLDIPGLLGAKTGYTDLAGGNLVVAFGLDIGHPVIAVVLGSSIEGRFEDVRELIRAARELQD
jgi:D-alanyl-D-alanine carboxypeptidase